ncbi:helix-turn-helix transcriptional regulator [Actinomycetospora cinnamomea]|uniref:Regulatory LuxR family protein n=1 Tax=Actinomycetospora cinnamomea TaxID=663609 RepID=A0A2U1FIV5_9PSEU|nr:LuxR C-terminal-related transcriptional regulator [Actinomycetospora cinnamomea]PVZ12105.1 regulatory LuxR family protein [Actinomycetospora cinnamomea]
MDTTQRDGAWLDLVADLIARPLTHWPVDRVVPLLVTTFGAPAGVFYDADPSGAVDQRPWPPGFHAHARAEMERWTREDAPREHPLLRYYLATGRAEIMQVAEVPERIADRRVQERWRATCGAVLGGEVVAQVSLPVRLGPAGHRALVVGRVDAFTPGEMALAGRLQRVLVGLDRQIAAHARWAARTGELAVPAAAAVGLTPRESAVLDLLAAGGTARAIARRLAVAERTVQKHLQHVYTKLGVADRLAAVQRAQLLGLLPPPELDGSAVRT